MNAASSEVSTRVIEILRAHREELRRAGIRHMAIFGSVARGDCDDESDVDLVAELDPEAGLGLFGLMALERRLAELIGRDVDLVPEPVSSARLRRAIGRDRLLAF